MPKIYSKHTLAEATNVRSIDYTLASPSGLHESHLSRLDWDTNASVQWQVDFFKAAVALHLGVKRLRLSFVRERLSQPVWLDLVRSIAMLSDLDVLCLSHMRSPSEVLPHGAVSAGPFMDEFLQESPRPLI